MSADPLKEKLQSITEKCEQYWNAPGLGDAEVHAALECIHRWAREALAAHSAAPIERETAKLRLLLFECIRELEYIQCVENCNSGLCATSLGRDLVRRGIELLGIRDLHEDREAELRAALRQDKPTRAGEPTTTKDPTT